MRKRFNAEEKQLIALCQGAPVEWQNVAIWHPGILKGEIVRDRDGWETVVVDNTARTPRLSPGPIRVGPGHLRAPAALLHMAMGQATQVLLAKTLAAGWPEHERIPTARTLNHGRCAEWAEIVCSLVPGAAEAEWDDPQSGLLHTFVVWQGRYYDAECPQGAADVTGLPVFGWWPQEQAAMP